MIIIITIILIIHVIITLAEIFIAAGLIVSLRLWTEDQQRSVFCAKCQTPKMCNFILIWFCQIMSPSIGARALVCVCAEMEVARVTNDDCVRA